MRKRTQKKGMGTGQCSSCSESEEEKVEEKEMVVKCRWNQCIAGLEVTGSKVLKNIKDTGSFWF